MSSIFLEEKIKKAQQDLWELEAERDLTHAGYKKFHEENQHGTRMDPSWRLQMQGIEFSDTKAAMAHLAFVQAAQEVLSYLHENAVVSSEEYITVSRLALLALEATLPKE